MTEYREMLQRILNSIDRVVIGKRDVKRLLLIAMMAGGHVLIEGYPGTGKTTTAKAFCHALGGVFKRMQFTPDMLPSDVSGFYLYRVDGESRFIEGPVFANVVLADELNRTTPRTQSALLEAMQEGQVTLEGVTHELPRPMMVVATQIPHGGPGTYPLTTVQADRFMLYSWSAMPDPTEELEIISSIDGIDGSTAAPVASPEQVLELRREVARVHVSPAVLQYILALTQALREHRDLAEPMSPRVGINLFKSSRAAAYLDGRDFVVPDDVKGLFVNVVHHRMILKPESESDGRTRNEVVHATLETVAVPKDIDRLAQSE